MSVRQFVIIGVALAAAILGMLYAGIRPGDVALAVARVGWGIPLTIAARYGIIVLLAYASWVPLTRAGRPGFGDATAIRAVRDAINTLLPTTQIGGDIVAVRLLVRGGLGGPMAAANVITDVFIQVVTQALFAVLGVLLLLWLGIGGTIAQNVATGLLVAAPVLLLFFLMLRRGAGKLIVGALRRAASGAAWSAVATADAVYAALAELRARTGPIWTSVGAHMLAWVAGGAEVWIICHFLGHPVTVVEAIAIEAIGQAARGAAFAVPSAIGVQEGAFVVLCAAFGIPADAALALSLVKRLADLAIGAPGFWFWYRLERRPSRAAA